MLAAAVRAGETVGHRGAGSVEFVVDPAGREFYFLELNTDLQTEHPLTELVTGIDLVEQQFRVAAGEPVSFTGTAPHGHALQFHVHAEGPSQDEIKVWEEPVGEGIRIDAGYAEGNTVTYPLLATLSVHGDDRAHALLRARAAIDAFHIEGPRTDLPFLRALLNDSEFAGGAYDTGIVARIG
jgi:acetyl-CoA carboxylase biotin carboxylase subunit